MAANFLGFFGKKKQEVAESQAPSTISAPPLQPSLGSVPPAPAAFAPGRKKVTQRLSLKGLQASQGMPRAGGDSSKIQLPGVAAVSAPPVAPAAQVEGTVDVPFSLVIYSIPESLLTADQATLAAAPEAVVEIGLPLAAVLSMLPSGKIEFLLSELYQAVPAGFIQPLENIPDYVNTPITLPLGQVVSRIPPHLLTLRSDQRPIDSNVLSMQDPFSREALEKAQAEAAAKAAQMLEEETVNQPVAGFGPKSCASWD
jgi:hypothetical protein